jgi:hypothetical protein
MTCPTTTSIALSRANIETLGFSLINSTPTTQLYRYQQYDMLIDTLTNKVTVIYGTFNNPLNYVFVSIVLNFAELKKYLIRNNIIVDPNL